MSNLAFAVFLGQGISGQREYEREMGAETVADNTIIEYIFNFVKNARQ